MKTSQFSEQMTLVRWVMTMAVALVGLKTVKILLWIMKTGYKYAITIVAVVVDNNYDNNNKMTIILENY